MAALHWISGIIGASAMFYIGFNSKMDVAIAAGLAVLCMAVTVYTGS